MKIIRVIYLFFKPYLPLTLKRKLVDLKFNRYHLKSFSQFGEDLIIINFFNNIKYLNKNYLDIGGFHPKMISNTYLLHENNWKGVIVDTLEFKLKLFKKRRGEKIKTINKAVVSNNENKDKANFFFFKLPFSEIDTLSAEFAKHMKSKRGIDFEEKEINTIKINDLLKMDKFDFVNIDIEGMDEMIITSIDFSNIYKPKLICFEIHDQLSNNSNRTYSHLINNGYSHLFTSGCSVGFYLSQIQNP